MRYQDNRKERFSSKTRITGSHSDIWDNNFFFEEDAPVEEDAPRVKTSVDRKKSRLSKVERDIETISFGSRNFQSFFFVALGILVLLILGNYFYIWKISSSIKEEVQDQKNLFLIHKENFKNFKDEVETQFIILDETSF